VRNGSDDSRPTGRARYYETQESACARAAGSSAEIQELPCPTSGAAKKALQALNAETLRGKIGDCKNPANTRAAEICLEKESETTKKNYSTFADAIRELLALRDPASVQPAASGPTGTPLSAEELTREFDNLQSAWQQYRTLGSGAAYNQYKGGTEAPVFSAEADQELLRAHMRELSFIYDGLLHH